MDFLAEQDMLSAKFLTRVAFTGLEPEASWDEPSLAPSQKMGPMGAAPLGLWFYFTVMVSNCAPETT